MDKKEYFAGSFQDLKFHWSDPKRAMKFKQGQTRTKAVQIILQRIETDIHSGSWLDVGTGAGFVQTQVNNSVSPKIHVGIDFSEVMLRNHITPYGERVLATAEALPFRSKSFSLVTSFFSLSDYPDISPSIYEACRCLDISGNYIHVDYASGDQYWEIRRKHHGIKENGQLILGNIHLRTPKVILLAVPPYMRKIEQFVIEYEVEGNEFQSILKLPKFVNRRFLYSEFYRPRDYKFESIN